MEIQKSLWLRGRYLLDDGYLEAKYNYDKTIDSYTGPLLKEEFDENKKQHGPSGGKLTNSSDAYSLAYSKKLKENIHFLTYGGYSKSDKKYKTSWPMNDEITQYYVKPQLKYTYGKDSYVIFGGDYKNNEIIRKSSYGKTNIERISCRIYN